MKRTVTRWVSEEARNSILAGNTCGHTFYGYRMSEIAPHRLDLVVDDGEPEGKCPCVRPESGVCCQGGPAPCCSCHRNWSLNSEGFKPCLSDWHRRCPICGCGKTCGATCRGGADPSKCHHDTHKKAEPATRERRVEGHVRASGVTDEVTKWYSTTLYRTPNKDTVPVTVIIREPVKEPTLYEAAESMFNEWSLPAGDMPIVAKVRAAFNREKAAREREGK